MRILQSFLFILMLFAAPFGAAMAGDTGQTATIVVNGLSCPFCAYGLEKHLKKVNGVEDVNIDMKHGKATVSLKPGTQVDDAMLREAVKKAGFTARDISHN